MRLMIVDDDPSVRQVLDVMLGVAGFDIAATAADGASAIAAAQQHPLDAVVLDSSLPDLNGVTVLRRLLELHPQLRVVVHSGHDDASLAAQMHAAGAAAFIVKGNDPQELIDALS